MKSESQNVRTGRNWRDNLFQILSRSQQQLRHKTEKIQTLLVEATALHKSRESRLHTPEVLNQGQFAPTPWETFDQIWRQFWLSPLKLGVGKVGRVGTGMWCVEARDAAKHFTRYKKAPPEQRLIWAQSQQCWGWEPEPQWERSPRAGPGSDPAPGCSPLLMKLFPRPSLRLALSFPFAFDTLDYWRFSYSTSSLSSLPPLCASSVKPLPPTNKCFHKLNNCPQLLSLFTVVNCCQG